MDICDWLRDFLKDGPKDARDIRLAAKNAGFTRGELREAKLICLVKTLNNWSKEHPFIDEWYWSLPEDDG